MALDTRCMMYDDSGNPLGPPGQPRGCNKGKGCHFAHPNEPEWEWARRGHMWLPRESREASSRGRRGRGSAGVSRPGPSHRASESTSAAARVSWNDSSLGRSAVSTEDVWMNTSTTSALPAWGSQAATSMKSTLWGDRDTDASSAWGAPKPPANPASTSTGVKLWGDSEPVAAAESSSGGASGAVTSASRGIGVESDTRSRLNLDASTNAMGQGAPPSIQPAAIPATFSPPHNLSVQQSPTRNSVDGNGREDAQGQWKDRGAPDHSSPRAPHSMAQAAAVASPSEDQFMVPDIAAAMRKENEGMRMLSLGITASTAIAGRAGASTSKIQSNPFEFQEYISPLRPNGAESRPRRRSIHEDGEVEAFSSSRPNSPVSMDVDIPIGLSEQWRDYVRTLSTAVSLYAEFNKLTDAREKQRRLQHSRAFQSASLVAAHKRIERIRAENDSDTRAAKKRLDDHISRLMRYPLNGLPVISDIDMQREDEVTGIQAYVEEVRSWMNQLPAAIEEHKGTITVLEEKQRKLEETKRQTEEAAKKAAEGEEARKAAQLDTAERAPISSTRKTMDSLQESVGRLEKRITDLDHYFEDLRRTIPNAEVLVRAMLVERGFVEQPPSNEPQTQEDGEVPRPAPRAVKTTEELMAECARLEQIVTDCNEHIEKCMQQLKAQQQRNLRKEHNYHELAADSKALEITMTDLIESRKRHDAQAAQNDKDMQELRELLAACQAAQPPPPPPPPSTEEIVALAITSIRPDIQAMVKQGLFAIKEGVSRTLESQEAVVCNQIVTTVAKTTRVVQSTRQCLDYQVGEPVPMRPPSPPPPSAQSV